MPKLILVDAHGYLHRAFHALPPLTTTKGEPVGALLGFTRMLNKLISTHKPDGMVVCFDAPGKTFRDDMYGDYKATRKETDPALKAQFPVARDLVKAMGLDLVDVPGFEADDLIATLAKQGEKLGAKVLIVSGDKDILQLVNDHIQVLSEPKQVLFDAKAVEEKWGVKPSQIADVLTLMGDSSDNVPGVSGVGEKTAVKLIQEHGSLDRLLENVDQLHGKLKEKFENAKDQIALSRKLIELKLDAPVTLDMRECRIPEHPPETLLPLLRRLEFNSLVAELAGKGALPTPKPNAQAVQTHYATILNEKDLKELAQTLLKAGRIAVDTETTGLDVRVARLVGLSFSWKVGHAAYVPVGHAYLGAPHQVSAEKALEILRPLLEDASVKKIGQNLKFDYAVLKEAGVSMKGLEFDTMLASYCLDPSRMSHRLKDLAPQFLGIEMTRIEELFPAGTTKAESRELPMDKVEIEKVAPYACADADCAFQLAGHFEGMLKEKGVEKLFREVEMPLVEILSGMESAGIRVDTEYLTALDREYTKELRELEQQAWKSAGQEFNLASSKQLGFILFEKLNLPVVRRTKTGYSTDEEVLTTLAPSHELPKILLRHRELSKLKSTYIDGLLEQADPKTSRVHTSFNQALTATGRLSSSDPNLQNIPIRTGDGLRIRRAFVPEKGCVFVAADYSQIDLRALAHLSGDAALSKAFHEGGDVHRSTAAEVFGVPLKEVTDEQRRRAKGINFGIVYGQQAFGLAQSLGIPMGEAQDLIEKYFKKYAGVKTWMEGIKDQARSQGYVHTLLGRVRYLPEIHSKNGALRGFAERTAMNTPVQGTSADLIKLAMIRVHARLSEPRAPKAKMLLQVHDDLLFEVPKDEWKETATLVRGEMENAMKLSVPLKADVKMGENWADMESVK